MTTKMAGVSSRAVAWECVRVQRGFGEAQSGFGTG